MIKSGSNPNLQMAKNKFFSSDLRNKTTPQKASKEGSARRDNIFDMDSSSSSVETASPQKDGFL